MSRSQQRKQRKPPSRGKVVVSWLFPSDVSGLFTVSLANLLGYDAHHKRRIIDGGGLIPITSGPNLSTARNGQARQFLEDQTAEWLLIVDSDMTFDPDSVDALIAEADPVKAPIVGGLCFGKTDTRDELLYWPTIYRYDSELRAQRLTEWPENTMLQVSATGTAFLLIHRTVLETMQAKFKDRAPWVWFESLLFDGREFSEDHTFCLRAQQCGFPIHVHTGVEIGHVKREQITLQRAMKWNAI